MKKSRSDARWNQLNQEQRQKLEDWLFEERLSYGETLERARKELGFKGSISSVRRFYENTAPERMLKSMITSEKQVREINETPVTTAELQAAGMKVVGQLFLNGVIQSPENMKDWSMLAKLLLQRQGHEVRYLLKQEENELRRQELEFARERFQYDILEQGVKFLPQLRALEERGLSRYEKNRRQNALRRSMFGPRIPEALPENEEEEKEMAREKVLFEEEKRKHHEEWLKRFGHLDHKAWRNKTRQENQGENIEHRTPNTEHRMGEAKGTQEGEPIKNEGQAEKPKYEIVRPFLLPFPPLPQERMGVEGTETSNIEGAKGEMEEEWEDEPMDIAEREREARELKEERERKRIECKREEREAIRKYLTQQGQGEECDREKYPFGQ